MKFFALVETPSLGLGRCFNVIGALSQSIAQETAVFAQVVEVLDSREVVYVGKYYDFDANVWVNEEDYQAAYNAKLEAQAQQG